MKKQYIEEIKNGTEVSATFWVKFKAVPLSKNGKPYINVELMDKTGTIVGRIWDSVEETKDRFEQGDYVYIRASALEYNGTIQLKISEIDKIPPSTINPNDYLPISSQDPEEMFSALVALLSSIKDRWIKALVFSFLEDPEFVGKFKQAPAAKSVHHAFLHGLLEHTLSVCRLGDKIADHYAAKVNRDYLLAGCFLHDIGKIDEIAYVSGFDYTEEGRLIGHIVIAAEQIREKASKIEGFPKETELLLRHLVLSHHGTYEFGSPKRPKIIEAHLVNVLDEMDAKVNMWLSMLDETAEPENWSPYSKMFERYLRRTPEGESQPAQSDLHEKNANKKPSDASPTDKHASGYYPFADLLKGKKSEVNKNQSLNIGKNSKEDLSHDSANQNLFEKPEKK